MLNCTLEYSNGLLIRCQVKEILSAIYRELSDSSLFHPNEIILSGQKKELCLVAGSPYLPHVKLRMEYPRGPDSAQIGTLIKNVQASVSTQLPGRMVLPVIVMELEPTSIY